MEKLSKTEFKLLIVAGILLVLITLLTKFEGGADIFDYEDTAKFFAGKYDAKIRTSHSYLYGLIHAPIVSLTGNFFIFKITSLLSLFLIIYSVYVISGKDKRALWLAALSPIVWYMAPWASPIQLSSLLFLWAWHFVKKYEVEKNLRENILYLFYSGALIGLAWAFWDGVLFFIPLFLISFFYNKKLLHSIYFIIFILIGSLPRIILDQILFGFAFFMPIRHVMASLALTFLGGFYGQGSLSSISGFIFLIIFFPFFIYLIFKKEIFKENKKSALFISLSLILLIINSQIRFVLLIAPLIIIILSKYLTKNKFVAQIVFSLVLIILVLNPYLLQIKRDLGINEKGVEFQSFVSNIKDIRFNERYEKDIIRSDLEKIATEFPNELIVIGNSPDNYRILANFYWGNNIKEFVSIEDYQLHFRGNPTVAEKDLCSNVRIKERRDICMSIWIRKAFNDETDYESIKYAISFDDELDLENFELVRKYEKLSLLEKTN